MARAFIKFFTLVFVAAVVFSLIKNPALVNAGANDTANLVRAVRGS